MAVADGSSAESSILEKQETETASGPVTSANEKNQGTPAGADIITEEDQYPSSWKLGLVTIALSLSLFCIALDNTIIATAIPRITDQFKALPDVGWYGSAYLLAICSTQLIFGKLYTFYSVKWIYLSSLAIFELGSLICGFTPTSTGLIIGRAIAGLGSAGIFSGTVLIIALSVPLQYRSTYTSLVDSTYAIASVAGPLMGGAFTDYVSWRWCFYINLPLGAVTALFIIFFFKTPARRKTQATFMQQLQQLDLEGTIFFPPGIVCLLLALRWSGTKYEWKDARVIILFVLFGILITGFVAVQIWKQERATVPPRVLKDRNFWASAWFDASLSASFFIMVYYLPIWFQAIKGVSATKSGIMNLPMVLSIVITSIMGGCFTTVSGYYTPFMLLSSVLMSIGAGLLSTFQTDTGYSKWIGYQIIFGAGVGFGIQQTLMAVQTSLPGPDIPIATALLMFCQTLGGALFVSIGHNVFQNELIKSLTAAAPGLNAHMVINMGATQVQTLTPSQYLPGVLAAYNQSLVKAFHVVIAMSAISILGSALVPWNSVKGKKIEMGAIA
ncbi:Major facilitator superfamily domain containing protein [Elaphomyces granulatus]